MVDCTALDGRFFVSFVSFLQIACLTLKCAAFAMNQINAISMMPHCAYTFSLCLSHACSPSSKPPLSLRPCPRNSLNDVQVQGQMKMNYGWSTTPCLPPGAGRLVVTSKCKSIDYSVQKLNALRMCVFEVMCERIMIVHTVLSAQRSRCSYTW